MTQMKILLTTHVFFPEHRAGTEVLVLNTAKELLSRGHDVEIVTGYIAPRGLTDSERFDTYAYDGIQVSRFFYNTEPTGGQTNVIEAEYNNIFFARWLRAFLARFNPDVVHFFHLGLLSASSIDACHELHIPMVMTPTDFWLICPTYQLRLPDNSMCSGPDRDGVNCVAHAISVSKTQNPFIVWVCRRLPRWVFAVMIRGINRGICSGFSFSPSVRARTLRAGFLKQRMNMLNRVIVPTRLMGEKLVSNGLDPDKVVFSRFGIRVTPLETSAEGVPRIVRIGFIGTLAEHKGAHLLISAVRSLSDNLALDLKIFGKSDTDPEYFERLRQLAKEDPRIHFCGTFPNEIIGKIFSELDVLVVPSIWYENTPLVIYSAQAAGCPVIASDLGGLSEIVEHEKNGLLFEAGDVGGLARSIERLVGDHELLKKLGANAMTPKSTFDYVTELEVVYDDVRSERWNQSRSEQTSV